MADFHEVLFDALPSPILVLDGECCVLDFNVAAAKMAGPLILEATRPSTGEALHCAHTQEAACGQNIVCESCVVRSSALGAFSGGLVQRKRARMHIKKDGHIVESDMLVTTAVFQDGSEPLVLLILEEAGEMLAARAQGA